MFKTVPVIIGYILTVLFIAGCSHSQKQIKEHLVTPKHLDCIIGKQWALESITTNGQTHIVQGSEPFLLFKENGNVSGMASINNFFGSMSLASNGTITWSKTFGSTRKAGPPQLMKQEDLFLKSLVKTNMLSIQEKKLIARSDDSSTLLTFSMCCN